MTWWQSLLIALVPATITAAITLAVCLIQNHKTKKEFLKKYELEQKNHISQTRFDTEFAIYKEISEKLVTLVSRCVSTVFPRGPYYEPQDATAKLEYRKDVYKQLTEDLAEANIAINKYAVFVPKKWYEQFVEIKNLCRLQITFYFELDILNVYQSGCEGQGEIRIACYERTKIINDKFDTIVDELREYIRELETKEVD